VAHGTGDQQPEQTSFLGFPARPEGDGEAVKAGRLQWYELAGEIQSAFADIDRAIAGLHWSGDGRSAFDAVWAQFSGHGTEATQHSREMGDHLLELGNRIEDAQHEWDLAMAAMAASTAIGIGLTFLTVGISDDVAMAAAEAAVGTMRAACTALEISLDAAVQVLELAIRAAVRLAVRFTWQFAIGIVSQEEANLVDGRGLGNVDLLQVAEFAGVSMLIPGAGRVTIGGREVLAGLPGAVVTGAATDAAFQGLQEVTEGKPFNVGEVLLSGALAAGGQKLGERLGGGPSVEPERWPADDSGYRLQPRDLEFLGLTREQIGWALDRRAPLGMTPQTYSSFRASLLETLRQEGIAPEETDIRLHGSSANFFSGGHKTLPSEADLADNPEARARLQEWLGDDPNRPLRRPFDSMHRLQLDEPSDYDLNISNDRMVEIARSRWDPTQYEGEFIRGHGYLNKAVVREAFPHLDEWATSWSARLGREVSHGVFGASGPFDTSETGISVHYRETDWIVHSPGRR
jgi:uncharacterized protein YukE